MIEERGLVVAVSNGQIEVEIQQQSTCGGCNAKSACGTNLISSLLSRQRRMTFENTIDAEVGDAVTLSIDEKDVVSASINLYLFPLLGLIAGAIVLDTLARFVGMQQELFQILGGLLGITGVLYLIRQQSRKEKQSRIQISRAQGSMPANSVSMNNLLR